MKLKIAIVVHGRFHAFDLARELLHRGHDVRLLTNYPGWAVEKFGFPKEKTESSWIHGILSRLDAWLENKIGISCAEPFLHRLFGQWAAWTLKKEQWDVIHSWSGVSEEILRECQNNAKIIMIMRGSAHIDVQDHILKEEAQRTGAAVSCPSRWMIERERREYALAQKIIVLSTFARESFIRQGISGQKLQTLLSGADLSRFCPDGCVIDRRCSRILSGHPLNVCYAGNISLQKGMADLVCMVRQLGKTPMQFSLAGQVSHDAVKLMKSITGKIQLAGKLPQSELPAWYEQADLFLFPTLHDGYPVVLAQAQAAGLPILTTTNCSGPDIVLEGKTGWVFPIRNPDAFVERLKWCDAHRNELAEMVRVTYESFKPRDWAVVAADFERICVEELNRKGN